MPLSANHEIFLSLLRIGIGHQTSLDPKAAIDWKTIEALAKQQGLLGIVLDGVEICHTDITDNTDTLPLAMKLTWIGEVVQNYEQVYAQYTKAIADLAVFYNAHGFRMMVLKGYACAMNWPRPEHRPCGDVDIYLFGIYKEADEALTRELGIKIDHSHQHHTVFEWQGFTVENHYDFVNVVVHRSSRELEKIFKSLAETAETAEIQNTNGTNHTNICLPSANLHALFLIRHMVSHFAAVGISLRQVLDWGFFVEKQGKDVDWEWLEKTLEEYHMKEFFDCINAICMEDLGFANTNFTNYTNGSLRSKSLENLKERILNDTLSPEFDGMQPKGLIHRVPFKYRRWKANAWKRELCYAESETSSFWGGVWNHLLKPAGI